METSESKLFAYPKTIFLDSNYISFLSLFIKLCSTVGFEPTDSSVPTDDETLRKRGIQKKRLEMDRLKDGKQLFDYLVKETQSGANIITSRFCKLEFLNLLLEKQAHENLLDAGVPLRLRSHKWSESCLPSLEQTDYIKVSAEWEQLVEKLSEYGVELKILEETGDYWRQIIETANVVMGSIMIQVPDAIVYAAAVTAEADEILTTDSDFAKIANYLGNPNIEPWISIATQFIQKLKEQDVSLAEARDLKLPKAKRL